MENRIIIGGVILLVMVNAWTVLRFWQDKRRACNGDRRIPEVVLLRLAMLGGSPGALIARRMFRHKTRKQPFSKKLVTIASIQTAVVIGFAIGLAV